MLVGLAAYFYYPLGSSVKDCMTFFLVALVLLQTFSREVLVVDYALNQAAITARFCVNKARPALHCNGRRYFAKQLRRQQERENQSPNSLKERLEMLPVVPMAVGALLAQHSQDGRSGGGYTRG